MGYYSKCYKMGGNIGGILHEVQRAVALAGFFFFFFLPVP